MTPLVVLSLLVAAGGALVVQNLLMARITDMMSTALVALVLNSSVGLVLLTGLLLRRGGLAGLSEVVLTFRPWFIIPGILGSFFVFANIMGYQKLGAGTTISIVVASQLILGLAWDLGRLPRVTAADIGTALLGAALLVAGVLLIATRFR